MFIFVKKLILTNNILTISMLMFFGDYFSEIYKVLINA